jgi:RNA polymerase sigma-70 factor, ECF subfamily
VTSHAGTLDAPPSSHPTHPVDDVGGRALSVEQLFRDHGPYVWRSLRRFGLSDSDADDVCQEVFVVVFKRLHEFQRRSSLRTWIYGISMRLALAHRRRASTRRELPTESPPEVVAPGGPHEKLAEHEARQLLDRALAALDDDKRAVFVLFEVEQLPMSEVAEALGCPLQTAYSRLHAAREQVQSHLKRNTRDRWGG